MIEDDVKKTLGLIDSWCIVAIEGYDGDSPAWQILSDFDDPEDCMIALAKARDEGFTARMIYAPILRPFSL